MGKDYGEPIRHDPDFKGPVHNRSCTDVIPLIFFIVYLGAWGFMGYYSITQGNVQKLLAPIDSVGRRCGLDSGLEDKKYLVFFDITKCLSPETPLVGCSTPQVCVEKCPTEKTFFEELNAASFPRYKNSMVCTDNVNMQTLTYTDALNYIKQEKCTRYILPSKPVLFRCIGDLSIMQCKPNSPPKLVQSVGNDETCLRNTEEVQRSLQSSVTSLDTYVGWIVASSVKYFMKDEREAQVLASQIGNDLVQARWYMVGGMVGVVIICFIYILLLRWIVGPVVWISIIGFEVLLGFLIFLCYKNYKYYYTDSATLHQTTNVKGYVLSLLSKHQTWLAILIVLAVLFVILFLVIVFLRKRISTAIALISEGSKAVTAVKTTVVVPIFPWIIQCAVIIYGVFILISLLSIGEATFKTTNIQKDKQCNCHGNYTEDGMACQPSHFANVCHDTGTPGAPCRLAICTFTGMEQPNYVIYLHIANLLAIFWTMFFIGGVSDMMLASTFSTWYWTFHKKDLPFFTLTSGVARTIRYHLGTVALGSLIIAIVRVIRVILEYIDHKLKKFDNAFTRFIMCCCKCACWCLENFLKFVNKNAYIMCAIHGKNFCRSAKDAFSLLLRNIVRVVVLDKVTDFVFFLSKLLISIGVGVAVYYLMEWNYVYEITNGERLHYNYIPAIVLSVATYLISSVFFNVYSMAVDTLFLCFLEDCERNDGSPEKPYFMSKNLMKILNKRNKAA